MDAFFDPDPDTPARPTSGKSEKIMGTGVARFYASPEARAFHFGHRAVRRRILWAERDGAAWHGGDPRDVQPLVQSAILWHIRTPTSG